MTGQETFMQENLKPFPPEIDYSTYMKNDPNYQRAMMNRQAEAVMPTRWGDFQMIAYGDDTSYPHLALVSEPLDPKKPVLVRIHSECMTGDLFGSQRCDCGEQLDAAMEMVAENGGVVIYLRQEGRGIGLVNKLHAYNLQDSGLDTADANTHLGFAVDERNYDIAIGILENLGISKIELLTNNPDKIAALEKSSITLNRRLDISISPKEKNYQYLLTKKKRMGHLIDLINK